MWILAGVVFAGAVQDFVILFISARRDGRSLGDLIKSELGPVPGVIALFGVLMIMIIILAVLALVVVKALANSPWGTFTLAATIPIAIFMGIYLRFIRPGRVGEMSIIGFVLLMAAIIFGQNVAEHPTWGPALTLPGTTLALCLIGYGFVASVLPVWFLLAPRDYLSTFLKVGFVVGARGRHHHRPPRPADAVDHPVHRRQRPGFRRRAVPVPVHHHRLRGGLRLPRADLVGHHAEDAGERGTCPLHRLWRDADGIVRRHHGADQRHHPAAGRILRDEQPGGRHRHDGGKRRGT